MLLKWDSATTSTIYDSVVSSTVIKACFVHSWRRLAPNLCAKIPQLTTLWCSISRTFRTNALVDHGGFLLQAALNWSHSSLCTTALHHIFVHCCLHRFGCTHIRSHDASYSCYFPMYLQFVNVHPGSYFWWLPLERHSGPTGVCVAAVSHWVAHCVKRLSFGSILLQSHLVEVFLEPCLAVVEWWGT